MIKLSVQPDSQEVTNSRLTSGADKRGIACEPEVLCRLPVHTAPGNESKANAAGKPPKRLAEWSESEDD